MPAAENSGEVKIIKAESLEYVERYVDPSLPMPRPMADGDNGAGSRLSPISAQTLDMRTHELDVLQMTTTG